MGFHGLRKRAVRAGEQTQEDSDSSQTETDASGVDEGDNVARFPLQKSFSTSRANVKNVERKSETPDNHIYKGYWEDIKPRSNSLPATPASDLSSSDRSSPTNGAANTLESSIHSVGNRDRLRRKPTHMTYERSLESIPTIRKNKLLINSGLVAIISLILAVIIYNAPGNSTAGYKLMNFQNDLTELGEKYNVYKDTMLRIQAGISTTFKLQDTASIVFLYDENNMDENIVKEFVNEVAHVSAKFLRNETGNANHIVVENSDLSMSTSMELISRYRVELEEQGVLLVQDLENVPVNLAMAFHYYCDEQDPLVKKTAILFTLNVANCHNGREGKSLHEVVEKCLSNKWKRLEKDMLGPLLTRVANVVVEVESGR